MVHATSVSIVAIRWAVAKRDAALPSREIAAPHIDPRVARMPGTREIARAGALFPIRFQNEPATLLTGKFMAQHHRTVSLVSLLAAVALLAGCPKKKEDPAPIPPPTVAVPVNTAPADLVPVEEDAGFDAGVDAADAAKPGIYVPTNVARLRACCAQIGSEARKLGMSPEAAVLAGVAVQCNAMAGQVGPNGNAPELGTLRNLLKGHTIPACQTF